MKWKSNESDSRKDTIKKTIVIQGKRRYIKENYQNVSKMRAQQMKIKKKKLK